jgi:hypothetical protein
MDAISAETATGARCDTRNQVRILTAPDPENSGKSITKVLCRYSVSGQEVSFVKNGREDNFEDALSWAQSFARTHGIENVIATNRTAIA